MYKKLKDITQCRADDDDDCPVKVKVYAKFQAAESPPGRYELFAEKNMVLPIVPTKGDSVYISDAKDWGIHIHIQERVISEGTVAIHGYGYIPQANMNTFADFLTKHGWKVKLLYDPKYVNPLEGKL